MFDEQQTTLTTLGLTIEKTTADHAVFLVPTCRPDLTREIDLIEEVGRSVGYDDIAPRVPQLHMAGPTRTGCEAASTTLQRNAERARDLCVALGFDEVQLFSMTSPEKLRAVSQTAAGDALPPPLALENPLREDLSVLRTLLLPGLLDALRKNQHHGQADVRLCEIGEVFLVPAGTTHVNPTCIQTTRLAGVLCGHRSYFLKPTATDALDFADVRGLIEERHRQAVRRRPGARVDDVDHRLGVGDGAARAGEGDDRGPVIAVDHVLVEGRLRVDVGEVPLEDGGWAGVEPGGRARRGHPRTCVQPLRAACGRGSGGSSGDHQPLRPAG